MLHWWTSAGERLALDCLMEELNRQLPRWRNAVVPGGDISAAGTVLRARILARDPPDLAHVSVSDLRSLARGGVLMDITAAPQTATWHSGVHPLVRESMEVDGRWMGIPLGVHRVNTMVWHKGHWDRLGLPSPDAWSSLLFSVRELDRAGVVPLVWSDDGTSLTGLFDSLLLAELGPKGYESLSQADGWTQEGVVSALEMLRRLRAWVPSQRQQRVNWSVAGREFLWGRAGIWFMPDWCRGELNAWGMREGQDYEISPVPGTAGSFLYQVDCLAAMNPAGRRQRDVQELADMLTSVPLQRVYNLAKGSAPVVSGALAATAAAPHWANLDDPRLVRLPALTHRHGNLGLRGDVLSQLLQSFVRDPAQDALTLGRQMLRLQQKEYR